jgi:hypothetical protein
MYVVARLPARGRELAACMRRVLSALAESYAALVQAGQAQRLPPLRTTAIRFCPEPQAGTGVEDWADPWTVLSRGHGDCDDLVIYRLTELLLTGERATVSVIWQGSGFHVRVRRANGTLEDPSLFVIAKNGKKR